MSLRNLDIDDLLILRYLGQGLNLADSGRQVSLTQPAITQRMHKMEQALGFAILDRTHRGTRLTDRAITFCGIANVALGLLEAFTDTEETNRAPRPKQLTLHEQYRRPQKRPTKKAPREPKVLNVPRKIDVWAK